MDESDAFDEITLLDYLAHGLFGFMIGIVVYCIYLLLAQGYSREVEKGLTMVWGRDIVVVVLWGLLFPIGCALAGLVQARWMPLSYLRDGEMLVFLIMGVLFACMIG